MAAAYRVGIDAPDDLFAGASCAFGVFDGVHRGHRFLLDRAREQARRLAGRFVVITFDIDPDERFHPERLKKLMSNEARIAELSELADAVAILPFTAELAGSSPDAFLNATFESSVPAAVHVGCDLRFGARAAGTVADLRRWGGAHGMEVRSHELFEMEGVPITATRIRLLLEDGRIEDANRLLGRRYSLCGTVLAGRGEGADMGFRTANLVVPDILRPIQGGGQRRRRRVVRRPRDGDLRGAPARLRRGPLRRGGGARVRRVAAPHAQVRRHRRAHRDGDG